MKIKSKNKLMGLNDIVIGSGLNRSDSYGWDHTPRFAAGSEEALYRDATRVLQACFREYDGLAFLTLLGAISMTDGDSDPPNPVNIAGVELAQALMLRDIGMSNSPTQGQVRSFTDALVTHLHLFMAQTAKPSSDAKASVLSRRMAQTLLVRHTYYAHHADEVFRTIGEELEPFGREALGMSLRDASKIALAAARVVSYLISKSSVPTEIAAWLKGENTPFDIAWLSLFEVPLHVLSAIEPGIGAAEVETVLNLLSIEPGALAGANPDHLHLDNPIWRKPFVKARGRWFCFSPGTLLAAHADVMSGLAEKVSSKPGELLGKARADALENMAAQTLSKMFPHGEILSSVYWTDPADGDEHETDLIVLIDQHAMIFEAKGHMLSAVARRGSAAWFRLFDDVVVKASLQASRLEAILRDQSNPVLDVRTDQGIRTISKDRIRHVVRFGISLERVTTASYGTEDELRARIERSGARPMPIFTIGDLWLIRDLIGSEGRCAHFLLRRAELELDHEFIADELDLIALYLKTGFVRLWRKGFDFGPLAIYGLSELLRFYVKGTAHFDPRYRLPKRTTPWWDRIIDDREQKRPRGWIDMIYDLLNVPLVSQEKFWSDIVSLRRRIRRHAGKGFYTAVLMQVPEQQHPSAFACVVAGKMSDMARVHAARRVFSEINEKHPDERLIVFCLDGSRELRDPALPYYRGVDWSREVNAFVEAGEGLDSGLFIAVDSDP